MLRDVAVYLDDIINSMKLIQRYVRGMKMDDFLDDVQVQDAVMRRLEVVGEAAKHIPEDLRKQHPEIPWREMSGLRDVIIHGYFGVNMARVYKIAHDDVPDIRKKLETLKKSAKKR